MSESEKRGRKYEKPSVKRQSKMEFPLRGVTATKGGPACRQCSSCHGCR